MLGVIEFASVAAFSELHLTFLERLVATIGVALNTIQANRRTEELLAQSQRLAHELQDQSAELQRTNAELEEKAQLLSEQKAQHRDARTARSSWPGSAWRRRRSSWPGPRTYKSEFLANMSHELRTPLNSLLLLARLLADNPEQNLTAKQIEFARTIHSAGSDLLVADRRHPRPVQDRGRPDGRRAGRGRASTTIRGYVEQAFAPQAEEKGLRLRGRDRPPTCRRRSSPTPQRLQQILRNLLSNAVKFTDSGAVTLRDRAGAGRRRVRRAGAGPRPAGGRVRGHRHRHRHLRRQAVAHLRGVPAGRRHDQPQVRRHRPRPVDQPRAGPPARRHDHGVVGARARARRSRCYLPDVLAPDAVPSRRCRRRCRRCPAAGRAAPLLTCR